MVVNRLVEMRDQPPEGLGRTPGPKALLYYLPRDADLVSWGKHSAALLADHLSTSARSRTHLWAAAAPPGEALCERPAPMRQWQVDFGVP